MSTTSMTLSAISMKRISQKLLLSCRQQDRIRLGGDRSAGEGYSVSDLEPANNKNSGFSAEAGAGCAFGGSRLQQERERGRRGIFETRHRLRPPREGRNDWGSKFRRPTLPAHPYSGFHTLEPLHTLYLLIPKPLDSTYPSSSRRWPIPSIFTSS